MSPVARAGGVALSVVAHVGAGALLLTLSVADWSQPLFVDLVDRAEAPGGAGAPGTASERPAVGPRAPRSAQQARSGGHAAPTAEPAPPPVARSAATPVPLPDPIPPADPPAPAPEPTRPTGAQTSPPTPPSSLSLPEAVDLSNRMGQNAPPPSGDSKAPGGTGSRPGGEIRGDAPTSAGGAAGSAIALGTSGSGTGAIPAEYGPYLQRFRQRVQESLVYPLAARRQGMRGTVELDVSLDPTGRVRDVRVARSSSHGLLDDAAVETVRNLGPLPFPESLPRRALLIRLPLVFDLR